MHSFIKNLKPGKGLLGKSKEEAARYDAIADSRVLATEGVDDIDDATTATQAGASKGKKHEAGAGGPTQADEDDGPAALTANGKSYSISQYFGEEWEERIVSLSSCHHDRPE